MTKDKFIPFEAVSCLLGRRIANAARLRIVYVEG